jgi:hypothetical protein
LFKIQDEKNIIFYSANPQEKGDAIDLPRLYDDFKDKQLVIKIGSSNASTFTYKDKIHNIVKFNKAIFPYRSIPSKALLTGNQIAKLN